MTSTLTPTEAFAAIPLAAVCCDQIFGKDEARVIRDQLLTRSVYQAMPPYSFGMMISGLLKRFREVSWEGLVAAAAPQLNRKQQESAFALACQLIHCDREVTAIELEFLTTLATTINLSEARASQILEVCELLHCDCLENPDAAAI